MSSEQFNVIVDGQLLPGFDHDTVLAQLQQQLKLAEAKARQLLAGQRVTIKRNVAAAIADAYCARLHALGVSAHRIAVAAAVASVAVVATETTIDYFSGQPKPLPASSNRGEFNRAHYRATAQLFGVVTSYAAATLLALGATLFYLIHFSYLLIAPPILFSATVFVLPLIALLGLCALLLRPWLPIKASDDAVVVARAEQPQLFALVGQLCAALAINAPAEITLNTHIDNTVAILPGWKNWWRNHYRLTLGLPLLHVGDVALCAGMIAGALRAGATKKGLRYSTLLEQIRLRSASCIKGEDWLQRRLFALEARMERAAPVFAVLRKLFTQSNRFLQRFAARAETADIRFARALLREQDRYLALIAGSAALPRVLVIEEKLQLAATDARAKNTEDRLDAGLVDNLPALIQHYYDSYDEQFERDLRRRWDNETTPRRDAPPIARERVEQLVATTGAIDSSDAALTLLNNADAVAAAVTQQAYRAAGYVFSVDTLLATESLTYAATQDILQRQQAAMYFNNWLKPFRFWKLAEYKLIRDMPLQDAAEQLSVCVNEIRRLSPDRFKLLTEYERIQNQLFELLVAQHVLAAGKTYSFRYQKYDGAPLQALLEERQQHLAIVADKLAMQETVMGGRITLGLRLCGQAEHDVINLHDALRLIHDIAARLQKLQLDVYQLEQLLPRHYQQREADYALPIKRLEEKIHDASLLLLVRLGDIPCPLDTRHGSLRSYVEAALEKPLSNAGKSATAQRARRLLDILFAINEKLSLLAADYGTIAEEAYRIEPIKLVATAQ
jgi:hypothetical protein